MIWHEDGGEGARSVLFLHGLGASGAVWGGVQQVLEEQGGTCWHTLDLPGHGASSWEPRYSVPELAAAIAAGVRELPRLVIVGHSLGAYVALALAGGRFGLTVEAVLGIGPKISWSATDVAGALELAGRPVRWYATQGEASARYRRVSGLDERIAPHARTLARGVASAAEGWRLAQDPRTFSVAGASFAALVAGAGATRIVLARGESDPMVRLEELRDHAPEAYDLPGSGHNVHVEDPRAVAALLGLLLKAGPP